MRQISRGKTKFNNTYTSCIHGRDGDTLNNSPVRQKPSPLPSAKDKKAPWGWGVIRGGCQEKYNKQTHYHAD